MTGGPVDVVVVGAGIVGAACARRLAADGRSVALVECAAVGAGTTAAAMGHLVALPLSEPDLALSQYSRNLWIAEAPRFPPELAFVRRGTLWVAAREEELSMLDRFGRAFAAHREPADRLSGTELAREEPRLASGFAGGLRVPNDAVLEPGAACRHLVETALRAGARPLERRRVRSIDANGLLVMEDGEPIPADDVVIAAGIGSRALLPELPMFSRKGHLVRVAAPDGWIRHQVAEVGYTASVESREEDSVTCNVQPTTGNGLLLGASRQYGRDSTEVEPEIVERLRSRAEQFFPGISGFPVDRAWAGLRPATVDHRPLIGPMPGRPHVWLATGHEGLGITESLGTAEILCALLQKRRPPIPAESYLPAGRIPPRTSPGGSVTAALSPGSRS